MALQYYLRKTSLAILSRGLLMFSLPRRFHRLFVASSIANLADGLVPVGVPLLALGHTREPLRIAAIQATLTLPWLLFALQSGALADRRDRRWLMVVAAALRAVVLVLAGIAAATGHLTLIAIYATMFLLGTGEVLFDSTSESIVPDLVDRASLGRANGRLIGAQVVMNNLVGQPPGPLPRCPDGTARDRLRSARDDLGCRQRAGLLAGPEGRTPARSPPRTARSHRPDQSAGDGCDAGRCEGGRADRLDARPARDLRERGRGPSRAGRPATADHGRRVAGRGTLRAAMPPDRRGCPPR